MSIEIINDAIFGFGNRIDSYEYRGFDESHINIKLTFSQRETISEDILEPDSIRVTILHPQTFIDALTGYPLATASYKTETTIPSQLTESEYKSLEEF